MTSSPSTIKISVSSSSTPPNNNDTATTATNSLSQTDLKPIKKSDTPSLDKTPEVSDNRDDHRTKGVARIKKEFIIERTKAPDSLKRTAENARLGNAGKSKKHKKQKKGQNKDRSKTNKLGVEKDSENYDPNNENEMNHIRGELKYALSKKKYDFTKAKEVEQHVTKFIERRNKQKANKNSFTLSYLQPASDTNRSTYVETKYKPEEIKKVDFENKLIVAPLTTVGNLPFRRICKEFGADITVSEMAVVSNILRGSQQELALLKRHKSEDVFGIQVAGGNAFHMTQFAQFAAENLECSFVDINVGCPIDVICNKGMGTGLMAKKSRFEGIVRGMKEMLNVPLSVKIRTGLVDKKLLAHQLVPKIVDWGADAITLHGRTKQQRYTKESDWNYISQCADVANSVPFIGNGDVMSYTEYSDHMQNHNVQAVMIGRGALIKPWVLTEIKEQRHWDISATERFDMLKKFTSYGMDHYGADEYGVELTRRFLLEWLSFLHRYIPVGLLERGIPQHINERPPPYKGRNELETLMASEDVNDWIEITKRLIPQQLPEGFTFLPKHRSNSYQVEG